jgi:hypothetical protein
MMRSIRPALALLLLSLPVLSLGGEGSPEYTAEREEAALGFVREQYPELASLLERLKPMNRDEYEKAIVELDDVRQALARLQQKDPERSGLALRAWKARSQVELLAAQLARSPSPRLERLLRKAIRAQLDIEVAQQRYERDLTAARLKQLDALIERLESERDAQAESRYQALVERARRSMQKEHRPAVSPVRESRLSRGPR